MLSSKQANALVAVIDSLTTGQQLSRMLAFVTSLPKEDEDWLMDKVTEAIESLGDKPGEPKPVWREEIDSGDPNSDDLVFGQLR